MSDNANPQGTRPYDGSAGEGIGRQPGRPGAARRTGAPGREAPLEGVAVRGATSRHLHEAAGAARRRATAADGPHRVAESASRHMHDVATRMAIAMQDSARDFQDLFALRGPDSEYLQELSESIGTAVEGMMGANARIMQDLFRLTGPAAAIDLQRRCATAYLDAMLHGSATLARAAHRVADHALHPLEAHVARRRQRQTAQPDQHEAGHGRVADLMRTEPPVVSPEDTVQRAVQLMREADLGGLPVRDGDRLIGMLTDRDIALRLVADARDPTQARVRDVMTPDVPFVFEDDAVEHVAEDMAGQRLRRLPVLNREKRLVGVISLVDLARKDYDHPGGTGSTGEDTGRARAAA